MRRVNLARVHPSKVDALAYCGQSSPSVRSITRKLRSTRLHVEITMLVFEPAEEFCVGLSVLLRIQVRLVVGALPSFAQEALRILHREDRIGGICPSQRPSSPQLPMIHRSESADDGEMCSSKRKE